VNFKPKTGYSESFLQHSTGK